MVIPWDFTNNIKVVNELGGSDSKSKGTFIIAEKFWKKWKHEPWNY